MGAADIYHMMRRRVMRMNRAKGNMYDFITHTKETRNERDI
jgi:hypothetical protein